MESLKHTLTQLTNTIIKTLLPYFEVVAMLFVKSWKYTFDLRIFNVIDTAALTSTKKSDP